MIENAKIIIFSALKPKFYQYLQRDRVIPYLQGYKV